MKSREQFLAQWADELSGLLLASFVEERQHNDFARDGRFMTQQLRRARDLLGRIYADLAAEQPPIPNGKPQEKARTM